MFTYHDWQLIRGLALLLVLGAFILHAFLIGAWQSRKSKREAAPMTEQDAQLAEQRKTLLSAETREPVSMVRAQRRAA